jgi:uncharacterized membrane protein YoaK (UPF0700 family)
MPSSRIVGPMEAGDRRGGLALGAAVMLAVVTGFVDAVGFARLLGVFPANQSGNLVFLGMALGGEGPTPSWRSATVIVAFALGIALAFLVGSRLADRRRGPTLLGMELALLATVMAISGPLHGDHARVGFEGWVLIVLTGLAMGVQTEVIRHVAGVAVVTTYETGALVRVGEAISAPLRRGREARYACELGMLAGVVVAYIAGAALGASALGNWRWPLVLPAAVLVALLVLWLLRPDWFAAADERRDPVSG